MASTFSVGMLLSTSPEADATLKTPYTRRGFWWRNPGNRLKSLSFE
jgi:hypothetical protein